MEIEPFTARQLVCQECRPDPGAFQSTVFLGNDGVSNQPGRVGAKAKDLTACSQHGGQARGGN
jgi:hypothetical protein